MDHSDIWDTTCHDRHTSSQLLPHLILAHSALSIPLHCPSIINIMLTFLREIGMLYIA